MEDLDRPSCLASLLVGLVFLLLLEGHLQLLLINRGEHQDLVVGLLLDHLESLTMLLDLVELLVILLDLVVLQDYQAMLRYQLGVFALVVLHSSRY
jgi:hypothetical protein